MIGRLSKTAWGYLSRGVTALFFLCIVSLFFAIPPLASAADNYSVSPLLIDLELEKRDIVNREITITNQSGRLIRVYPTVNEISVDGAGEIKGFVEPSRIDDRTSAITSWIQVPRKRIEIPPGESYALPVTIKLHPETQPGEYHAFIGIAQASNMPQAEQKVRNGVAPGVSMRISVDKVQNQFLRLERFTVERLITDNKTGTISYSLHNPGDDPVSPAGEIIFYDNNGTEVHSIKVNPDQLVVEAGESVALTADVPGEFSMGKYKAFLSVEYGEHLTASVHDTAFFYVLPVKLIIALFVVVLILSVFIGLYVHRRYDVVDDFEEGPVVDVPLYIRQERSASQDHDVDLSKKD